MGMKLMMSRTGSAIVLLTSAILTLLPAGVPASAAVRHRAASPIVFPPPPFFPSGTFVGHPTSSTTVRFSAKIVGNEVIIDGSSVSLQIVFTDPDAAGGCPKDSLVGNFSYVPIDSLAVPHDGTLDFTMTWIHVSKDTSAGVYSHPSRWTLTGVFTSSTSASGTMSFETFADNRYTRADGTVLSVCPVVSRLHSMTWTAQRTP